TVCALVLPPSAYYDRWWGWGCAVGPHPSPLPFPPHADPDPRNSCPQSGNSLIECQNQILGEEVGVTGTPFTLHYASDRVPGRQASYSMVIPLSEATVPAPLDRIDLDILVAGQRIRQSFPPLPNQQTTFTWDSTDGYGRVVQGRQPITIRIGYHYPAAYLGAPGVLAATFAVLGSGVPITGSEGAPQEGITIWQEQHDSIGGWDARGVGLGGWSLSVHHAYDPVGPILYLGNGERRSV